MQPTRTWLRKLTKVIATGAIGVTTLALFAVTMIALPGRSDANPAIARMTGKTCAACHVPAQEPRLNRYGQAFKNCGYRDCGGGAPVAVAPRPQFGHAMCNRFACNSHGVCRFRIRFGHGGSREITIRKGESYNVRDVHPNDHWCFIEPNGVCEMKNMKLHAC